MIVMLRVVVFVFVFVVVVVVAIAGYWSVGSVWNGGLSVRHGSFCY